jgi:carboxymethylenebutenolidase
LPHSHTTITRTSSSVHFAGDKLASKQLYWDQASVLVQVGLLERDRLPVVGVEAARKVLDPDLPSNELITGAGG